MNNIFKKKSILRQKEIHDEQNNKILNKVKTSNSDITSHTEPEAERKTSVIVILSLKKLLLIIFYTSGECLSHFTLVLALVHCYLICFTSQQAVCHPEITVRMLLLAQHLECATAIRANSKHFRRISYFLLFPLPLTTSTANPRQTHKHSSP